MHRGRAARLLVCDRERLRPRRGHSDSMWKRDSAGKKNNPYSWQDPDRLQTEEKRDQSHEPGRNWRYCPYCTPDDGPLSSHVCQGAVLFDRKYQAVAMWWKTEMTGDCPVSSSFYETGRSSIGSILQPLSARPNGTWRHAAKLKPSAVAGLRLQQPPPCSRVQQRAAARKASAPGMTITIYGHRRSPSDARRFRHGCKPPRATACETNHTAPETGDDRTRPCIPPLYSLRDQEAKCAAATGSHSSTFASTRDMETRRRRAKRGDKTQRLSALRQMVHPPPPLPAAARLLCSHTSSALRHLASRLSGDPRLSFVVPAKGPAWPSASCLCHHAAGACRLSLCPLFPPRRTMPRTHATAAAAQRRR
ncbi:hypothetical protein M011DRAFT_458630 [Sporormia fimetaria CBS 119925]|uniref:Uncharacterized protein n=1 Tax=Sporormia fimetaria CBS 119925 TaxID=1340428 RepID=A0A6A6VCP7_9PLEO|nr:hypothetical protein M011DRAFT_458630 [Sporormia fimetaria CBS 119925]